MAYIEAECFLVFDERGLIGLSLIAMPQTEAECFCRTLPRQLQEGRGNIDLNGGILTFVNPDEKTEVSFLVVKEYEDNFEQLWNGNHGQTFSYHRDGFLTPGFKLVLTGREEDRGKRVKLGRF
jgi:hypothetical protein